MVLSSRNTTRSPSPISEFGIEGGSSVGPFTPFLCVFFCLMVSAGERLFEGDDCFSFRAGSRVIGNFTRVVGHGVSSTQRA
jgi:hypothetical protein